MHGATIKRIACALGLIARSDFSFTRTAHAIPVGVIGNAEGTKQALALCDQFQIDFRATREMVEKIDAHGLFAPRQSKVTLEGGEVLNLTDFQVIDKAAFNKLSDAAFLDLRKSGALGLLYCHLASTNIWTSVVHQASLRKAER